MQCRQCRLVRVDGNVDKRVAQVAGDNGVVYLDKNRSRGARMSPFGVQNILGILAYLPVNLHSDTPHDFTDSLNVVAFQLVGVGGQVERIYRHH